MENNRLRHDGSTGLFRVHEKIAQWITLAQHLLHEQSISRKIEILNRTIKNGGKRNERFLQVRRDVRVAHPGAARAPAATEERRLKKDGNPASIQ
jgi:hypothetical protein